jgi:hypothetical protein
MRRQPDAAKILLRAAVARNGDPMCVRSSFWRICATAALCCAAVLPTRPGSALIEPFEPTYLISDEEFNDAGAMSCEQIQDFLNQRKGILKSYVEEGKSAAQHICEQAAAFAVNPRIMLVMIQKEMALVSDPQPDAKQLAWAAGCGPGWASTRGFATQMACMARTLRRNFDRPGADAPIDGVVPFNKGTLALYRYTVHVAGNRDFWRIWNGWFPASVASAGGPAQPAAQQPAAPVAPAMPAEVIVDSRVVELTPPVRPNAEPCKLGWTSTNQGSGGHHWLTPNVARQTESTNFAVWRPNLRAEGRYRVSVFVPAHGSRVPWSCGAVSAVYDSSNAIYVIQHRDGIARVALDQAPLNDMWTDLGTYAFAAGTAGYIVLTDLTGEVTNTRWVSIDDARFTPVP